MESLKILRKQRGLTQKEVADELGISQQAYANYEKEETVISDDVLNRIATLFGTSPEQLRKADKGTCMMDDSIEEFLAKSYTAYHSTANAISILRKNGYQELSMDVPWRLKWNGRYFVTENGSALIAFNVGDFSSYAFHIAACHTDSPSLKVKGNSLIDSPEGKRINVEKYGGLILYSFLDIPLRVAGRMLLKDGNNLKTKLVVSDYTVNIPSLCIHHNPSVNDGMALNVQTDMLPLLGDAKDLFSTLSDEEVVDADLYCVPSVSPYRTGIADEFLASPRIDNLTSFYAVIQGLLKAEGKGISIGYCTDNEEIGSLTKQGACSFFLEHVLEKINLSLNKSRDDFYRAIGNGFLLSIDNGHAVHPAHPEKSDVDQKVYLNKGIVIKHHTNYSTDGLSSAVVKMICEKNDVLFQEYYNRSDIRCGSTIGNVTSSHLAVNSCDIGLAQLAMHSGIETVGYSDIGRMEKLVRAFYETELEIGAEGVKIK